MVESEQLRRETETLGPNVELTYWRKILARFSVIKEQFQSPIIQAHIEFLALIKSKILKVIFFYTYTLI